jgi:putative chitinase
MLLKKGDNNENVKLMQQKLGIEPAVTNFGPKTEEAVKAFQTKNGLTPDGIVGDTTWAKIMGQGAPIPTPTVQTIVSVGGLKLDKLRGHIPDGVIQMIPDTAAKFEINTPLRLAHFLAQCGHESGGFRVTQENLNYSAKGLAGIFKKYFPTEAAATPYARNPQKIANKVYANRMANGSEASGDGYKFRGRGYIQLTGRDNYTQFSKHINKPEILTNPDLVATDYSFESALFFFDKNKLWSICDQGVNEAAILALTKRVNGGTHGLEDRKAKTLKYYGFVKA